MHQGTPPRNADANKWLCEGRHIRGDQTEITSRMNNIYEREEVCSLKSKQCVLFCAVQYRGSSRQYTISVEYLKIIFNYTESTVPYE